VFVQKHHRVCYVYQVPCIKQPNIFDWQRWWFETFVHNLKNLFLIFFVQTLHQALGQFFAVQVLSNEYKFVDTRFVGGPRFLGRTKVDLFVHALKDKFRIALSVKGEQTLGAKNVGGSFTWKK